MDENAKITQREIAKDKIQIILSSIAVAVLVIMELYIMINFKSNFIAMAIGILLMIVALFFLISALLDISLKTKDMEAQRYEEIYNAQKASYLVIKKSFEEMDQRLKSIEENSSLPAEDIINAQKAVAKVTISRSKENTDALMNSNDELINQLVSIQEKLDNNNIQIIEKQQSMLKETNFDIQQKILELNSQLSSIEGRIQGGMSVIAAQPVQVAQPVQMASPPVMSEPELMPEPEIEPIAEDIPEEPIEDLGLDLDAVIEEEPAVEEELSVMEELPEMEEPVEDLGLDLDAVVEEEPAAEELPVMEEPVEDLGLDLDAVVEEPVAEEAPIEEPVMEELPVEEEISVVEEAPAEEVAVEEPIIEETPVEEEIPVVEETPAEEPPVEEVPAEEIVLESTPVEEPVVEESIEIPVAEEAPADDLGAGLDALLEEVGGPVEEAEPQAEPEPTPTEEAPAAEEVVIPDVGVDLTDPNRVMSAEEIEKLFASI